MTISIRRAVSFLFVSVAMSLGVGRDALAQVPAPERSALISFYNSTNGAGWTNRTNWRNAGDTDFNAGGTECTWFGITCAAGHVTKVLMSANQLSGSLPSDLSQLTSLTELNLESNAIGGTIPASLGTIVTLRQLRLSANLLSGSIPAELGSLTELTLLYLNDNDLSGPIPSSLAGLTKLVNFYLARNALTGGIPPFFGSLPALRILWLTENPLGGTIPVELANLADLTSLYAAECGLTGSIPEAVASIPTLAWVRLERNSLTGLPPKGFGRSSLIELRLAGNALAGEIPASWSSLTGLTASSSDFRWLGLWTDSAGIASLLASKQIGGDWKSTQTAGPDDPVSTFLSTNRIDLAWTAIPYTSDPGRSEVVRATSILGPWTEVGQTASKLVTNATITGLSIGTQYFFAIRSVTDPHFWNPNEIVGEPGKFLSARSCQIGSCRPGTVSNTLRLEKEGATSIRFRWGRVANTATFYVHEDTSSNGTFATSWDAGNDGVLGATRVLPIDTVFYAIAGSNVSGEGALHD